MFSKILIVGWIFIVVSILVLFAFPQLLKMIPHLTYVRFFLEPFVLVTIVYRVVAMYRRGTKQSKRD